MSSQSKNYCPLSSRPVPSDHCHVFHFGLSPSEVIVLESLFRLHADLRLRYSFSPSTDVDPAHILFVDADRSDSLAQWHSHKYRYPDSVAVFVGSQPPADPETVSLTKPLSFRHLDEIRYALKRATPDHLIEAVEEEAGLHILVVDDSATARELMQACVTNAAGSHGVPVHIDFAASGEESLRMAGERHYDLVFLDVIMPGMDGYEVCRLMKEQHIPRVALLTGRGEAADYELGRAAGCDHYLAKPASAAMVNTVVRLTAMKKALPTH